MSNSTSTTNEPGFAELLSNLVDDTRRLVRDEIALARSEISEKARHALRQSIILALGVFMGLLALIALAAAAMFGLAHALTPLVGLPAALWLSPLIIGGVAALVGAILVQRGLSRLRARDLTPTRTIETLRENSRMLMDRLP